MIKVDPFSLELDPVELKARLQGADDTVTLSIAHECELELKHSADCFYTFTEATVKYCDGTVDLGFGALKSRSFAKYIDGCDTAYVAAVSLGIGVDRLLRRLSVTSAARLFIADAVASTLIESLCDRAQGAFTKETRYRYSPGYGDLPLATQEPLLNFLRVGGIKLTESKLMLPTKSVTFIAGVKK